MARPKKEADARKSRHISLRLTETEYLNISRGNAYTLLHREDFPTLRIGKRMIAPRDKFLTWIDQQMSA